MPSTKMTIEAIAKQSQVSIATVSRIINNKDNVKPETRQKVLKVMEDLKFLPSQPSALSDSGSKVILMCIPEFHNPFNSLVIDGVQNAAHAQGYDILILQSHGYYTDKEDYTNILKSNSIAGILILAAVPHAELLEELSFRCPVVMCSEYPENYGVSYVSIDDVASAKKAVNYLISTGRHKIGFINANKQFKYARHREKGYMEAMHEANLEINPSWITHISSINYRMALSNALHILKLPERPDAFFTCSDVFAISAINAAKQLNLKVPTDVSVIGFDNIELSIMSDPPVTTIEQPSLQLGYQACELLIEKINNPESAVKQIILDTELIVRNSTVLANT